jgi:serine phosphatase RsbU (regulator of sigma subunit)
MDFPPASVTERLRELIYAEKAVAWLRLDSGLILTGAGGELRNHGLTGLRLNEPAVAQAFFLEGLLPPADPYECVPSVELTDGRAADLHFYLERDTIWIIVLDVTAERDAARRMQQIAYDMTLSREREALLNRRLEAANSALGLAYRELETSRDTMRDELRRKQMELDEARTLQLALVPPPLLGLFGGCTIKVDIKLEPAKEVGGDLVDHFCIEDELLVLVLGDVSGKGAGAALFMARTHALLRGIVTRPDASRLFRAPHEAVRLVNDALAAGNSNCTFVTLMIATLDVRTLQLTYVRAGHVPPFLRRANGIVERLGAAGGLPPGVMADAVHKSTIIQMSPGEELLIVTDGITEAMDPSGSLFGDGRVAEFVRCRVAGEAAPLDRLLAHVRGFEAGSPQSDDIAAILLTIGTT